MNKDNLNTSEINPNILTPNSLITETIEKVENILKNKFKDYMHFDNGAYTISRGSTQVMLIVRPYTNNDTCIECSANVVNGAIISNDLMLFLLRKNAELHFGGFGLLFDGTIIFSHSISGANLDENELTNTIDAVATISDYYDDILVREYGGKRACDLNQEL